MNPFINPAPTSGVPDPSPAANWIQECTRPSHQLCQQYRARAAQDLHRPRRLLRLCEYQSEIVQLVEGVDIRDDPYVTLSHRWGSPDPPKLSAIPDDGSGRISITDLKSGVSLSSLPRTFRDALNIVSRCGLRYLWIDSLCILQDKDADGRNPDWEREAAKVGDIYAGANFNIAALGGSNSDSGLFPNQQRLLLPVIRNFTARQARKVFHKLRYDVEETSTVLCDDHNRRFNEAILDSELLSRGWAFQEIFLTPANLFCTSEQMWWSCSHASFSQTFPMGRPESLYSQGLGVDGLRAKKVALMIPDHYTDPIGAWMEALTYYTRTSVTYGDDRLAAISGIANTFRALFPDKLGDAGYHSGVWSFELVRQLDWHRSPVEDPPVSRLATNHYMPSWSPAGFKGRIFRYTFPKDALPIEFISLETSELDSLGRAKEAKQSVLHLRGVPVEMMLDPRSEKLAAWPKGFPDVKVDVYWDSLAEMDSARETSASYRALALYCGFGFYASEGLLLRDLQVTRDSAEEPCNRWVRCAWFRWSGWQGGYIYRAHEAFQFGRYNLPLGELEHQWSSQKREPSGDPIDLEDIFIV